MHSDCWWHYRHKNRMTSLHHITDFQWSQQEETTHYQAAAGSDRSLCFLVFISEASVAGGLWQFQPGGLTEEAQCHFLTANSFFTSRSPPPTHIALTTFLLSLALNGKLSKGYGQCRTFVLFLVDRQEIAKAYKLRELYLLVVFTY